jgi:hypothetical protein
MLKERGQLMVEKKEEKKEDKPATSESPKPEEPKPSLPGLELPKADPATAPGGAPASAEIKTNSPAPATGPKSEK